MRPRLLIFLFLLLLAGKGFAADLTVHAAASLTDALQEIGVGYERESGDKLQFNFGASSMLARQIEQGAPADLFLSADEAKMDTLEKKNLLVEGSRRSLLSNSLVIVVGNNAATEPKSPADLTNPDYKKIALAEPHSVPAGIYAREYLEKIKLWDALKEKLVPTENVRSALAAVESGNADAGLVYKTDAMISKKVKVAVEIPVEEGPKISYPVAILKSSKEPERARKLEAYLFSVEAQAIFKKYGFALDK